MYYPSLEQIKSYADAANLAPIYREINADLETPVSAYLKVANGPYSYLLESVEGGERIARYSFIGADPQEVLKTGRGQDLGEIDPLKPVEEMLSKYRLADVDYLDKFNGGAVGYISYDAVRYFEQLPTPESDPLDLPESIFMLSTTYLVFDHLRHKIKVVSHAYLDGDIGQAYSDAVDRIDQVIRRLRQSPTMPEPNTENPSGRRHRVQHAPGILRRDGCQDQGIHHRGRRNPDCRSPAHVTKDLRASVPDLQVAQGDQSVAVHVLPRLGRLPDRPALRRSCWSRWWMGM